MSLEDKIRAENCDVLRKSRLPCTIITGFLGAGKTTFLNNILTKSHDRKLAVIENEFGEVGVDKLLINEDMIEKDSVDVVLMPNGCMCCRVRGDLIKCLQEIHAKGNLDGIIIEMSGLSEVAPVLQTFFVDEWTQRHLKIDAVICVIDCRMAYTLINNYHDHNENINNNTNNIPIESDISVTLQSADTHQLLVDQLNLSDVVLMNKADAIHPTDLVKLKQNIIS